MMLSTVGEYGVYYAVRGHRLHHIQYRREDAWSGVVTIHYSYRWCEEDSPHTSVLHYSSAATLAVVLPDVIYMNSDGLGVYTV
jgi:hypothetical protein